ncbi:hypothetical protein SAMN05216226_10553 [Halovenus aranensis]|jgi:hypothetical protein|uniref:Uncharacterized protein n=1 Tax=Halovenus aranensis TaxID=890420 RepID=A0A1G8UQ57_9EURY|nr:hypothetical protein [Halovenus aranensis]SDJ55918.1 hypothetical protein SAMN05216226_10553 [Halovenus aranensis]
MSVTVHLDTPLDGSETLDCESVKLVGDVLLAESADDRTRVVPMGNVAGVEGDEVEKAIEAVEYEGGRVTELVTRVE